jgi:hypothetical protein
MPQTIRHLSAEMNTRLEAQRSWVHGHFIENANLNYSDLNEKLRLLQIIIDSKWIDKSETVKLQCLGVTLGDAFAQHLGLHWVEIEDEYGIDPALRLENTSILLFPLTMISKRIERDEQVNINELFNGIKEIILKKEFD